MAGSVSCGSSEPSPAIIIEFRDELKKDNTYLRTRHNSLRCFPICSPVHKTKAFCGYPLYVSVTVDASYSSQSASDFILLGEIKPLLKDGLFRIGELYDISKFKPITEESASADYFCARMYREEQADKGRRRLLYIFMPPNRWHCSGRTREKESYCFSATVLVEGLAMFKQDSPCFHITRRGRASSLMTQDVGEVDENDDGSSSGLSGSSTAGTRPLKSPRLSDVSGASLASDIAAFTATALTPMMVNSSASSGQNEGLSVSLSRHSSSRKQGGAPSQVRNQSPVWNQSQRQIPIDLPNSSVGESLRTNTSMMTQMAMPEAQGMIRNSNIPATRSSIMTNQMLNPHLMQVQTQWPPLGCPSTGTNQPQTAAFVASQPSDLAAFAVSALMPVNRSANSDMNERSLVAFSSCSSSQKPGGAPSYEIRNQLQRQVPIDLPNSGLGDGLPTNNSLMRQMPMSAVHGMHKSLVPGTPSVDMTNQMLNRHQMQVQTQWPPLRCPSPGTNQPQIAAFSQARRLPATLSHIPHIYQQQPEPYEFQAISREALMNSGSPVKAMGAPSRYPLPFAWLNPASLPLQSPSMHRFDQEILQQHHDALAAQDAMNQYQAAQMFVQKQTPSLLTTDRQQENPNLNIFWPKGPLFHPWEEGDGCRVSVQTSVTGRPQRSHIQIPTNLQSSGLLIPQLVAHSSHDTAHDTVRPKPSTPATTDIVPN